MFHNFICSVMSLLIGFAAIMLTLTAMVYSFVLAPVGTSPGWHLVLLVLIQFIGCHLWKWAETLGQPRSTVITTADLTNPTSRAIIRSFIDQYDRLDATPQSGAKVYPPRPIPPPPPIDLSDIHRN